MCGESVCVRLPLDDDDDDDVAAAAVASGTDTIYLLFRLLACTIDLSGELGAKMLSTYGKTQLNICN